MSDERWVIYDNVVQKMHRASANVFKDGFASREDYALRVVGFQGCTLLQVVINRQNDLFNCILLAVKQSERYFSPKITIIDQSEKVL